MFRLSHRLHPKRGGNGTVSLGEPSGRAWIVTSGLRTPASPGPSAVEVNDSSVACDPAPRLTEITRAVDFGGGKRGPRIVCRAATTWNEHCSRASSTESRPLPDECPTAASSKSRRSRISSRSSPARGPSPETQLAVASATWLPPQRFCSCRVGPRGAARRC
jgi:hypothetical protein